MARLSELRRWINTTRVEQGIFNPRQGDYSHVLPGGCLEGPQWAHVNMSPLRESTAHLTQETLAPAAKEESDVDLLRHLLELERQTGRRESITKLFEDRLKILGEQPEDRDSVKTSDPSRNERRPKLWQDIEISFLSDERVQIRVANQIQTLNYAEFGFEDHRNQKPNRAWITLRVFAEYQGILKQPTTEDQKWRNVEKRVQEIRRLFRERFGISKDPLPYVKGAGYTAMFKIGCSPSYHT